MVSYLILISALKVYLLSLLQCAKFNFYFLRSFKLTQLTIMAFAAVILPEPQDTNVIETTEQEAIPAKKKKRRHDDGSEKLKKSKHRKRRSKHESDEE